MTEPEQSRDERDDLPEPVVHKRRVGISPVGEKLLMGQIGPGRPRA